MRVDRMAYVSAMGSLRGAKTLSELTQAKELIIKWGTDHGLSAHSTPIEHALNIYEQKHKQIIANKDRNKEVTSQPLIYPKNVKPTVWERLCKLIK